MIELLKSLLATIREGFAALRFYWADRQAERQENALEDKIRADRARETAERGPASAAGGLSDDDADPFRRD